MTRPPVPLASRYSTSWLPETRSRNSGRIRPGVLYGFRTYGWRFVIVVFPPPVDPGVVVPRVGLPVLPVPRPGLGAGVVPGLRPPPVPGDGLGLVPGDPGLPPPGREPCGS